MGSAREKILDKCGMFPCKGMSQDQRAKVLTQLGQFVYELSTVRFSRIVSVFLAESGEYEIRECLRIATVSAAEQNETSKEGLLPLRKSIIPCLLASKLMRFGNQGIFGG